MPRRRHRPRFRAATALAVALAVLAVGCTPDDGDDTAPDEPGALRLEVVSTRPDHVTGGDVLLAVHGAADLDADGVRVEVDDRDVSDAFAVDDAPWRDDTAPARLVGLVDGLDDGTHRIVARAGDAEARVEVVNHPVDGPLLSGPHQSPFVCTTEANGLGAPEDDCWARGAVRWQYVTDDGSRRDLADPAEVPADAATLDGDDSPVPFLIRVEKVVLNRAVVTIAVPDPEPGAPTDGGTPRSWDPTGWNGRLVHRFGGGCGATFSQGSDNAGAADPELLADGYAVVTSTLTSFRTACNDVVAAETVMVAKEHFTETYGEPVHTIGAGGSGGAIQQLLTAQNYPGLLDAIAPAIPFPDAVTIAAGVADCGLLGRFFGEPSGRADIVSALLGSLLDSDADPADPSAPGSTWSTEQRQAVSGFASPLTCAIWKATYLQNLDPTVGCAAALEQAGQVYGPDNPRGARCTFQDSNVNLLGRSPGTGDALRPLDNLGVQYGLEALNAGALDVEQFLTLNEQIGGYDIDGGWQPERMRAGDEVLDAVYGGGRVTAGSATSTAGAATEDGAGGLVDVPILLLSTFNDAVGDIHDRQRVLAIRERLRLPDGSANPTLATWTFPGASDLPSLLEGVSGSTDRATDAVRVLDEWLTAATVGDTTTRPTDGRRGEAWRAQLAAARPDAAADRCELPDGEVVTGADAVEPGGPCDTAYPAPSDPRRQAGAPQVNDVVACSLVPVDPDAPGYAVDFTAEQADRLRRAFPDGVCDWSRQGRGQQVLSGTWQRYG